MPDRYDESIRRATDLLKAVEEHEPPLPNGETHRDELEETLRRLEALSTHRRKLEEERRAATAVFRDELRHLADQTRLLRTVIQGSLGLRSEKLSLFGILPLGARKRRARVRPVEEPQDARQSAA